LLLIEGLNIIIMLQRQLIVLVSFLVFHFLCIPPDIQEPYNVFLLPTTILAAFAPDRGPGHHHHQMMWGETPEELQASINFKTPDDQDAYGNKVNPVENLTPVFKNNYDKLYVAVDKMTGAFKECKDMKECEDTVHWLLKLSGTKMEAMVFEGKESLIEFTNKIKKSTLASNPGVSCQPLILLCVMTLTVSQLTFLFTCICCY
jgi:hypothetical protein